MSHEQMISNNTKNLDQPEGTVVVIPAYNEDRFIGSVVLKTRRYFPTVVVIDDGSTDDTASVAEAAGAVVIRHDCNQGKSAAIETAFKHARSLSPKAVVMLDGDGQHHPEDITYVLQPILEGQADIVVGSRFLQMRNHIPVGEGSGSIP